MKEFDQMKKSYEEMELVLICFTATDILTASNGEIETDENELPII